MANKQYVARETAIVWSDTSGDETMSLNGLAADGVQIGAQHDWGAGSTAEWYEWRMTVQFNAAPTVGETIVLYLATSDGSNHDGELGTSDASGDTDSLKNIDPVGLLTVTSADASHDMTASGIARIATRYVSAGLHNNTSVALKASNDVSMVTLTPIPPELQ